MGEETGAKVASKVAKRLHILCQYRFVGTRHLLLVLIFSRDKCLESGGVL